MVDIINLCFVLVIYFDKVPANDDPRLRAQMKKSPDYDEELLKMKEMPGADVQAYLARMEALKKMKKDQESVFEPYWVGGEWVYYRTTLRLPKKFATTSTTTASSVKTTTTHYTGSSTSPTTPYINYMCQHPCLHIYEDFGVVCGQRFNGWTYDMRQFDDACDLINENCINPFTKPTKFIGWFRGPWYILYRGPCYELTTEWVYPPTDVDALLSRNQMYVSIVAYNKANLMVPERP